MKKSKNLTRIPILVSVKSRMEAILASKSGADFIDAKEPNAGALGKLPVKEIQEIILALQHINFNGKITATYGDSFEKKIDFNSNNFISYFFLGLDAVKIGFDARGLLAEQEAFSELIVAYENIMLNWKKKESQSKPTKILPVLMIDKGVSVDFLDFIMETHDAKNLFGFMVDTKFKVNNNLFEAIDINELKKLFEKIHFYNLPYGVAGSLDESHSEKIKQIEPCWAGYRGGVCNGDRRGKLSPKKIKLIINSLKVI